SWINSGATNRCQIGTSSGSTACSEARPESTSSAANAPFGNHAYSPAVGAAGRRPGSDPRPLTTDASTGRMGEPGDDNPGVAQTTRRHAPTCGGAIGSSVAGAVTTRSVLQPCGQTPRFGS